MTASYHSSGKLLLTGEYLVLKGAEALALPLKRGQSLQVLNKGNPGHISWISYYKNNSIFEGIFSNEQKEFISTSDKQISSFLEKILSNIVSYLPNELNENGLTINTFLEFPLHWGLGSSSSLIYNLAQWLQINPFSLNDMISEGSGYDIACAKSMHPIIYKKNGKHPSYSEVQFDPPYKDYLFFIYTGKKQNSRKEIRKYLNTDKKSNEFQKEVHAINQEILKSQTLSSFEKAIQKHEKLISGILQKPPVQQSTFPDFPGTIKSLGAWGGDFILATWKYSLNELREYFLSHNLDIIFSWEDLIKNERYA
jgi:mevalonate kinase